MAKKPQRGRGKPENPRKYKKKTSPLVIEKVEYVDYKDVDLLSRFMSDRAKIKNRRVAGNDLQQQREVANAIKIAREMALLPYSKRVASTRTGGRRGDRNERADRDTSNNENAEALDNDELDDQVEGTEGDGADEVVEVAADENGED